jgi:hypothetical protein
MRVNKMAAMDKNGSGFRAVYSESILGIKKEQINATPRILNMFVGIRFASGCLRMGTFLRFLFFFKFLR